MVQHACIFDEYDAHGEIQVPVGGYQRRCRAVKQCESGCSKITGCIDSRHRSAVAFYHDPNNHRYEVYDELAGFHPTLDPVLFNIHL